MYIPKTPEEKTIYELKLLLHRSLQILEKKTLSDVDRKHIESSRAYLQKIFNPTDILR